MSDTAQRWTAVANAVQARMQQLALSQAEVSRLSNVSDFTVRKIMQGTGTSYRPDRLAKIAVALQWPPDAIDRLLRGEPPDGSNGGRRRDSKPATENLSTDERFARLEESNERIIETLQRLSDQVARALARAERQRR